MADARITPSEFFDHGGDVPPNLSKAQKREARKAAKEAKQHRRHGSPIEPRTETQADYIDSLLTNEVTFGIGPAGVGKTYVPARLFGHMLKTGEIEKIYVARPNISKAKHRNGFLPGTLEEKTAPWLVPIYEGIKDGAGSQQFDKMKAEGKIEEVPFEFIQGRTFNNAAFIVDEAENLDMDDLYITLTRIGEDCTAVFCGDIFQARIPNGGLGEAVKLAEQWDMESVGVIEFKADDIVRSRQAKQWAKAFAAHFGHANLPDAANCDNNDSNSFTKESTPNFIRGV